MGGTFGAACRANHVAAAPTYRATQPILSPSHRAPIYGTTIYGAPIYGTPIYGTPIYGATIYGATIYGATTRRDDSARRLGATTACDGAVMQRREAPCREEKRTLDRTRWVRRRARSTSRPSRTTDYLCASSIVIRRPMSLAGDSTLLMSPSVDATLRMTS